MNKTPNQDAACIHGVRKGWCIAVADGLGSRKLSHIGSKAAVQLVRQHIRSSEDISPLDLSRSVRRTWLERFESGFRDYESTCLWAHVDAFGHACVAQTGDGLTLVKSNGVFQRIGTVRPGFGNQTTTLAQADNDLWQVGSFELAMPGDGVLVMTDGISDDLIPDQLEPFFDVVYQRLACTNRRRVRKWLTRELHDWSTPRHGDDKSIAGIFRLD